MALPAVGGRALEAKLRAAEADPHPAEPDPVPQDADQRSPTRSEPGSTRSWRTPESSSAASRPTSSASPVATCSTRWSPARPTRPCSPTWRRQAPREDPRAQGSTRGTLRHRTRADRLPDPRAPRLPRRGDRPPVRSDRGADRPIRAWRDLLMTIPGVKQRTAEVLIAEIGVDMTAFPTAEAPRLLGRRVPRQRRVRRQTPFRQDPQRIEVAQSHARGSVTRRDQDQGLLPRRPIPAPTPRRGPAKAITAVGALDPHRRWHMLHTGELYNDLGGDYFNAATPTAPPNAWSDNSKRSDTLSPSNQRQRRRQRRWSQPERYFPVSEGPRQAGAAASSANPPGSVVAHARSLAFEPVTQTPPVRSPGCYRQWGSAGSTSQPRMSSYAEPTSRNRRISSAVIKRPLARSATISSASTYRSRAMHRANHRSGSIAHSGRSTPAPISTKGPTRTWTSVVNTRSPSALLRRHASSSLAPVALEGHRPRLASGAFAEIRPTSPSAVASAAPGAQCALTRRWRTRVHRIARERASRSTGSREPCDQVDTVAREGDQPTLDLGVPKPASSAARTRSRPATISVPTDTADSWKDAISGLHVTPPKPPPGRELAARPS